MTNTPGFADHGAPRRTLDVELARTPFVKRARKFLVSACGVAAMVVSTGVLHGPTETWVNAALAIATAAGVYQAKNAPTL